ncbi:AAA family ATPase [Sorangium sp. So ce542]|uniref:AAA family ATPase n=1 Tax=Sorangium sp. So ce542 TaxID=3133316 RepID=UPI003F5FA001
MRLQWFQVQGYKNLRAPVRLADLGRLNLLHGDNNVGKSNLLESIGLFFVAIQALREQAQGGPRLKERYARHAPPPAAAPDERPPREAVRGYEHFAQQGYPPAEIFNLKDAGPIVLEAELQLDREKDDPSWLGEPIVTCVRLERGEEEVTVRITELRRTADGVDLAAGAGDQAATDAALTLVLERLGQRVRRKEVVPRFALVRADRTLTREASEGASPLATREPLPRALGKVLHDAESATGAPRERFKRFVAALGRFRDLVGPGQWRMRFDTDADRAELVLDTGSELLPLRLMGSGIQQIAVLCARLVMTGADIIGIEEPELNLRWSAQRALRDVLDELAADPEAPSQLLITSHSGQFEKQPPFYLLTRSEDGPRIHKVSAEEAWEFTQPAAPSPPSNARAPRGYLTMEGVVQVPPEVQQQLGLSHGGGVVFVREKDGHYRMLTNDQYADLFEEREPQQ